MLLVIELFLIAAVFCALPSFFIMFRNRAELLPKLDKIPRSRYAGIVLAAVVLLWCVPHINAVFESDSVIRRFLYPGIAVMWILCSVFLDYLFARAFGVFCIFLCYTLLNQIFRANVPGSAFFAVACYLIGIYGLVICAKPYYLRDTMRFALMHKWFRTGFAVCAFYIAVTAAVMGALVLLK